MKFEQLEQEIRALLAEYSAESAPFDPKQDQIVLQNLLDEAFKTLHENPEQADWIFKKVVELSELMIKKGENIEAMLPMASGLFNQASIALGEENYHKAMGLYESGVDVLQSYLEQPKGDQKLVALLALSKGAFSLDATAMLEDDFEVSIAAANLCLDALLALKDQGFGNEQIIPLYQQLQMQFEMAEELDLPAFSDIFKKLDALEYLLSEEAAS